MIMILQFTLETSSSQHKPLFNSSISLEKMPRPRLRETLHFKQGQRTSLRTMFPLLSPFVLIESAFEKPSVHFLLQRSPLKLLILTAAAESGFPIPSVLQGYSSVWISGKSEKIMKLLLPTQKCDRASILPKLSFFHLPIQGICLFRNLPINSW